MFVHGKVSNTLPMKLSGIRAKDKGRLDNFDKISDLLNMSVCSFFFVIDSFSLGIH